jgi:glyoxylase-like metal-dependent hydrolase (beta-lactamase superfamily II)
MPLIRTLRLGTCNAYLISGEKGFVLIDAGNRHKGGVFARHLESFGIAPKDIRLIIATHIHFDHIGSCMSIKTQTRAKVMVHQAERHLLEKGTVVIPPGLTPIHKAASFLGNRYFKNIFQFPPCPVDREISKKFSLEEFGIDGEIVPTPGHTKGSLSILLKSGEAFVGDLAVNYLPFGLGGYLPPYGENISHILDGWETLLKSGASVFYPGHGFPIPAAKLLSALKKHRSHSNG